MGPMSVSEKLVELRKKDCAVMDANGVSCVDMIGQFADILAENKEEMAGHRESHQALDTEIGGLKKDVNEAKENSGFVRKMLMDKLNISEKEHRAYNGSKGRGRNRKLGLFWGLVSSENMSTKDIIRLVITMGVILTVLKQYGVIDYIIGIIKAVKEVN